MLLGIVEKFLAQEHALEISIVDSTAFPVHLLYYLKSFIYLAKLYPVCNVYSKLFPLNKIVYLIILSDFMFNYLLAIRDICDLQYRLMICNVFCDLGDLDLGVSH